MTIQARGAAAAAAPFQGHGVKAVVHQSNHSVEGGGVRTI